MVSYINSDGTHAYLVHMALNQELFGRVRVRRVRNASLIDLLASPQVKRAPATRRKKNRALYGLEPELYNLSIMTLL